MTKAWDETMSTGWDLWLEKATEKAARAVEAFHLLAGRLQACLDPDDTDKFSIKAVNILIDGYSVVIDVGEKGSRWNFIAQLGVIESQWPFEVAHQIGMMAFRDHEARSAIEKVKKGDVPTAAEMKQLVGA